MVIDTGGAGVYFIVTDPATVNPRVTQSDNLVITAECVHGNSDVCDGGLS